VTTFAKHIGVLACPLTNMAVADSEETADSRARAGSSAGEGNRHPVATLPPQHPPSVKSVLLV